MWSVRSLLLLCGLVSCARLVGIHDYQQGDAGDGSGGGSGSGDAFTCAGGSADCSLVAGVGQTCLRSGSALYCWGQSLDVSAGSNRPVLVVSSGVTRVSVSDTVDGDSSDAASLGTSCYLDDAGSAWCWGRT